ncbi:MAG: TetR/AcrR family transcriptional regulator [Thermodesulfobacteriota bacterium]
MTKRTQILEVATRLVALKGFKDSTMKELAKITGVAHGTIFYHYKSKEDLFVSILEEIKNELVQGFNDFLSAKQADSGLEMVEDVVRFYLNMAGVKEDQFLLLHRHYAYELAKTNTACRKSLESIYDCFVDIFEKAILKGQQDGSIMDVSARKTALILFTMVDGLVRLNTYNLYDAGALYEDLILSINKILKKPKSVT